MLEELVDGWHGAAVFVMVHCEMCAVESSPIGCVGLTRWCGGEIAHVVGEGAIVEGHLVGNEVRSTHGEKKVLQCQFDQCAGMKTSKVCDNDIPKSASCINRPCKNSIRTKERNIVLVGWLKVF